MRCEARRCLDLHQNSLARDCGLACDSLELDPFRLWHTGNGISGPKGVDSGRAGGWIMENPSRFEQSRRTILSVCPLATLLCLFFIQTASADEAGVSFWLPGQYGSFAAEPSTPGWSFESTFYHATVA